ncbi:MobA/MobL family protein [Methylobacterium currus]|uniref:MobA/MobL family protein n=1 Tax=Methylobacterium currus TaxID=2051553 RepID=UPI001E56CBEB|nr:MobA/MobL family protein [Methylobacterium currus]UHC17892.1 MobA/MobL family protein [Methylobacterium currus]
MAIYHLRTDRITRRKGQSAVASAAYYADEPLTDHRTGLHHVMPPRTGLLHREIVFPSGACVATPWDRQRLWNAVEAREKRKDSLVALLWFVALPQELSIADAAGLARSFADALIKRWGCVIDLTVRDTSSQNRVGYLLTTTHRFDGNFLGEQIDFVANAQIRYNRGIETSQRSDLLAIRSLWAEMVNAALAAAGFSARVDHRSLKDQGFNLIPQSHLGSIVARRTRRGEDMDNKTGSVDRDIYNAKQIMKQPDLIRRLLESRGEPFDAQSARRAIDRYVDDAPLREELYQLVISGGEHR